MRALVLASCTLLLTASTAEAQSPLRLLLEQRIGSIDGPLALTEVGGVALLGDAGLVVTQPQDNTLLVISADGKLVRTIGRKGGGPGEFRSLDGVGVRGDSIWVADVSLRRMSYFALDGRLLAEVSWPGLARSPATPVGNGYTTFEFRMNGTSDLDPDLPWPIWRLSREGRIIDTVAVVHTYSKPMLAAGARLHNPLSDGALSDFTPDGRMLVVVERRIPATGRRGEFTVTWVSTATRDTVRRTSFAYEAKEVTPALITQYAAVLARSGAPPERASDVLAVLRAQRYLPPVSRLVVVDDGVAWLARERTDPEPIRWYRINPTGELAGYVDLPWNHRIVAGRGPLIWVMERDEMDVPYIARYRLAQAR